MRPEERFAGSFILLIFAFGDLLFTGQHIKIRLLILIILPFPGGATINTPNFDVL
jgi:hypothetical protein